MVVMSSLLKVTIRKPLVTCCSFKLKKQTSFKPIKSLTSQGPGTEMWTLIWTKTRDLEWDDKAFITHTGQFRPPQPFHDVFAAPPPSPLPPPTCPPSQSASTLSLRKSLWATMETVCALFSPLISLYLRGTSFPSQIRFCPLNLHLTFQPAKFSSVEIWDSDTTTH